MLSTRRPFVSGHALPGVRGGGDLTRSPGQSKRPDVCSTFIHEGRDDVQVGQNGRKRQRSFRVLPIVSVLLCRFACAHSACLARSALALDRTGSNHGFVWLVVLRS